MSPRFLFAIVLVALAVAVQAIVPKIPTTPDPEAIAQAAYKSALEALCKMTIDQAKVDEFVCMLKTISPANLKLHQDCFVKAGAKLPMTAAEKQVALCEKDVAKAEKTANAFTCVTNGAASAGVDMKAELTAYKSACKKS